MGTIADWTLKIAYRVNNKNMQHYYEVRVTKTSKPANSKHGYEQYNKFTKTFATVKESKEYIKEWYQGHKKEKIYNNGINGETKHTGYCYSWKEKGSTQGDNGTYYLRDWIEVREIKATTIII